MHSYVIFAIVFSKGEIQIPTDSIGIHDALSLTDRGNRHASEVLNLHDLIVENDLGDTYTPTGKVAVVHTVTRFYPPMFAGIFHIQRAIKEFKSVADHVVLVYKGTDPELQESIRAICDAIGVQHTIFFETPELHDLISEKPVDYKDKKGEKRATKLETLTKLYTLNLEKYVSGYEKAVFLDIDVVALRRFDDVFAYPGFSMALWEADDGAPNSGVMVFEPAQVNFSCITNGFRAFDTRLDSTNESSWYLQDDSRNEQRFLAAWLSMEGCGTDGVRELPSRFHMRSTASASPRTRFGGWLSSVPTYLQRTATFVHLTLHKPFYARKGTVRILGLNDGIALLAVCRSMDDYEAEVRAFPRVIDLSNVTDTISRKGRTDRKVPFLGTDYIPTFVTNDLKENLTHWRAKMCDGKNKLGDLSHASATPLRVDDHHVDSRDIRRAGAFSFFQN